MTKISVFLAMKLNPFLLASLLLAGSLASHASADSIVLVSGDGVPGGQDTNVTVCEVGVICGVPASIVSNPSPWGPSDGNTVQIPGANWVNIPGIFTCGENTTGQFGPALVRDFRTTFELPAGFSNASVSILAHADNWTDYIVNGIFIGGMRHGDSPPFEQFFGAPETGFTNDQGLFNSGINEVVMRWTNSSGAGCLSFKATVTFDAPPIAPVFGCSGFKPPMQNHPVKAKKNRAFPLKMEMYDSEGFELTGADIIAAPVVQVIFAPASGGPAVDVSDDVLSSGQGSEGNQFEFTDGSIWQFNLKSTNYTAEGEYLVTAFSGDESEYTIDPACVTSFVID